ncbi:twin-arginine translocase TatA/TatE family subunit [Deinococcus hopiensis]|uniref:twin-arginine translocase TatA/TatE family subunit n=1 Tax=Deinococcus hopiensis TaxID=309885 RepID=UPI0009FC9204|nr:twin-arginine translocase TatA/TatE family subunit [Deinococcus hopiensis]
MAVLVVALLAFGPRKLPEPDQDLREFQAGTPELRQDLDPASQPQETGGFFCR